CAEALSKFWTHLVLRRLDKRLAKLVAQLATRGQFAPASCALLQMRDDLVICFNDQFVAQIGIRDFSKFTALHVKAPSLILRRLRIFAAYRIGRSRAPSRN